MPAPRDETDATLADRIRPILARTAADGTTITYAELARQAGIHPPHSIHRTTAALEFLIRADHAAGRPLLATVAVSGKRGGLPAPGFFHLCSALGRYFGPDSGPQAELFHTLELKAAQDAAT